MASKVTRRKFIQTGAVATAVALGEVVIGGVAEATAQPKKVAVLAKVKPWTSVAFNYPEDQPAVLLDVGKPVTRGVGPGKSIVAFSSLCQHMGCPVTLDQASKSLVCPCHISMYDPARQGMAFAGPAPEGLPLITLKVEDGNIYATGISPVPGISSGLVYGLACDDG